MMEPRQDRCLKPDNKCNTPNENQIKLGQLAEDPNAMNHPTKHYLA